MREVLRVIALRYRLKTLQLWIIVSQKILTNTFIWHHSQELNFYRILTKDLHLLHVCGWFCAVAQKLLQLDLGITSSWWSFHNKIIFTDEAHFHRYGYVNKQNSGIKKFSCLTRTSNASSKSDSLMDHAGRRDQWTALLKRNTIYKTMATLMNFFWQELNGITVSEIWFQLDSATCHIALETSCKQSFNVVSTLSLETKSGRQKVAI